MKHKPLLTSLVAAACLSPAGSAFSADAVLQSDEMYPLAGGGVLHVFRQNGTLKVKESGTVSLVMVGGGGAGGGSNSGVSSVAGGKGGNGVVILRYRVEPEGFVLIFR